MPFHLDAVVSLFLFVPHGLSHFKTFRHLVAAVVRSCYFCYEAFPKGLEWMCVDVAEKWSLSPT